MSKKQREKVEDEVRYHKEFNHQHGGSSSSSTAVGVAPVGGNPAAPQRSHSGASGSSPDTTGSVFDPQQPSSTDHM